MIKFTSNIGEGKTLVGLGLSVKNLERLVLKGDPIAVSLADLGIESKVIILIFCGSTEESMHNDLKKFMDKNTLVFESGKEGNGH